MDFSYYIFIMAILLLLNYKKIESVIEQYHTVKSTTKYNHEHPHNLVIDLGYVLMNKEGVEQYEALKPKLEQVRRYCLNANNQEVNRIVYIEESQFEPVKLKIV
jgi:hypothetical protein